MKVAIIGGTGRMGMMLEALLKKHGVTVFTIGRQTEAVADRLKEADVVIFSLSLNTLGDFLKQHDTSILKGKLLVDLSSQVLENSHTLSEVSQNATFIHLLFGPDVTILKDQHIAVSEKITDPNFLAVVEIFRKEGAEIFESSPERHDYMMALVQALSQFNSIALAKTLSDSDTNKKELEDFSSITFSLNAAVISRIVIQKPELWANIQFYNAHFIKILERHKNNIEELIAIVRTKDHEKFDAMFEEVSAFWKEEKTTAFDMKEVKAKVPQQSENSLGVLGPRGSYSDQASVNFSKGLQVVYFDSIGEVVNALAANTISRAVLPLENSIQGTIFETLDGLYYNHIKILDEFILPIRHVIAGTDRKVAPSEVKVIYSHPQALGQCAGYIRKQYPHAKLVLTPSTSAAFKKVKDEGMVDALAIGSKFGAELQGLSILEEGIQDMENNETRFVLVSKETKGRSILPYVILVIDPQEDRPGLLYSMLGVFKERGINIMQLESRPSRTKLGAYIFYIKISIDPADNHLEGLIRESEKYGAVTIITH